jgi:hypothetical protein
MSTHLLLNLQLVDDWRQLRQNLVCLLVVFKLGGDKVGEVAEGLRCVEDLRCVSVCVCKYSYNLCSLVYIRSS